MTLSIQSFGDRLSFEMIRDGVVIGGLAFASKMRSPKGNPAFASGKAHVHGEDAEISAKSSNSTRGGMEYDLIKHGDRIGLIRFDWKGKATLKISRVDGGEDTFKIKPKGVNSWWFLVEQNGYPVLELRPSSKYDHVNYNFDVRPRSRRMPERIMDELCIYVGFAANIYMAKVSNRSGKR